MPNRGNALKLDAMAFAIEFGRTKNLTNDDLVKLARLIFEFLNSAEAKKSR